MSSRRRAIMRVSVFRVKLLAGILGGLMLALIVYFIIPPIMALTQSVSISVWKASVHPLGLSWGSFSLAAGIAFLLFVMIFGRFRRQ
jgi:hypothetical protein